MVKVPSLEHIKSKFKKRVEVAGPDYEFKVANPLRSWADGYKDAWDRIHEGLREAIDEKRMIGGVERKGTPFWKERTVRKGPPRWRDETPKSVDYYGKEINDFINELSALVLEKKKRKGDPANVDGRVKPIQKALHELKKKKRATGGAGTPA
jgi:hypothetical protein